MSTPTRDFDDDWIGPELPALGRRLVGREARAYQREAGFTPEQAVPWADALVGPYEAGRAVAAGLTLEAALGAREAKRLAGLHNWVGVHQVTADTWVRAGFDEESARPWMGSGMEPAAAAVWAHLGFTEPAQVRRWVDKLDGADLWRSFNNRDFVNMSEVEEWLDGLVGAIERRNRAETARRAASAAAASAVPSAEPDELDLSDDELEELWASLGFNADEAGEWRVPDVTEDIDVGTDDELVLELGAHTLLVGPSEAAAWRTAGFDPVGAAPWLLTGLEPNDAWRRAANGETASSYVVGVALSDPDLVVVWGDGIEHYQLGTLSDFVVAAVNWDETLAILSAGTWSELEVAVGRERMEEEFGSTLDNAWSDVDDTDSPRPADWLPDDRLELGDWACDQPRVDDPFCLDLPRSVMDLCSGQGSMVSGEFVWWTAEVLPRAARAARLEGKAFVRCQLLLDQATRGE